MANKYYEMYINEEGIDESLLNVKIANANFEDHFWHLAALSLYYQKLGDEYLEKVCISKLCDLNFSYTALIYFEKYGVLPEKLKVYLTPFSEKMKQDKLEQRISYYNKKSRKINISDALVYSLTSLSVVPLMLFLVFVLKLDTKVTLIISIAFLLVLQMLVNPSTIRLRRQKKLLKTQSVIDKKLNAYLSYNDHFSYLFNDDLYVSLIKAKNDKKRNEIIAKIKENM